MKFRVIIGGIDITMDKYFLHSSEIYVGEKPSEVTTVLGSCISVCLRDRFLNIGGINHFMLPLWSGEGLATPKYGNIAIAKLLEKMELLGCKIENIEAKIFGGASVIKNGEATFSVGKQNILLAQDLLKKYKIPIIASNIHGSSGRKLLFLTHSGVVYIKQLEAS